MPDTLVAQLRAACGAEAGPALSALLTGAASALATLGDANATMRADLADRERVLVALRTAANAALEFNDTGLRMPPEDDLDGLMALLPGLVAQQEARRVELANQRFAMDQHAIVSISDTTGRMVYVNDKFCRTSGYARTELIGQNHRMMNSGVHPPGFFATLWQTITAGQVWHGEICNKKRNGQTYWVDATIVPFLDLHGAPYQFIAIRSEITARKRMAETLAASERLYRTVVNSLREVVFRTDAAGRWSFLNPAWTAITGFPIEASVGRPFLDFIDPRDRDAVSDVFDALMGGARPTARAETRYLTSAGGTRWIEVFAQVDVADDGTVTGLTGSLADVTERRLAARQLQADLENQKATERALLQAKEAAESASRSKSEFLANMSHEIRTPMNGIMGMTDLVLESTLDAHQRGYLEIVKSSADALLDIINDILDFSKIEAGKMTIEAVPFDFVRLVQDTLRAHTVRAQAGGLELLLDIDPAMPRHLVGDPGRLRQVLTNLTGNAIKFTRAGEIVVALRVLADDGARATLQLSVRDTGIGIPADKHGDVFESFQQEDGSTTRRFGGTGLGLSITRRLVGLMGGAIALESEVGVGSTFSVTLALPVLARAPATPALANGAAGDGALAGRSVMLVDDNQTCVTIISAMLARWQMRVLVQRSGVAALAYCRGGGAPVDCIVMDYAMPGMNGFDTAAALAEVPAYRDVPIVMLSSSGMLGDATRCRELGIQGYLLKPASHEELYEAVLGVVGRARSHSAGAAMVTRHSIREAKAGLSVLLVEDNDLNQRLASILLAKWGHRVTIANNGVEALALHAGERFDLILMDLQMPQMGGFEATAEIRRRERAGAPRSVIVAMTANAFEGDRDKCIAGGMDDYLSKPFRAKTFDALLKKYAHDGGGDGDDAGPAGAHAASVAPPASAFDYGAALRLADPDTVALIGRHFMAGAPAQIAAMRRALAARDSEALRREAHTLHGLLGNFRAAPAMRLAAAIDRDGGAGDVAHVGVLIDALDAELALLAPHL
jgi:two-component system sensor histidine kinase/response regulator